MKVQAILPTAGAGSRFKSTLPKPLVSLGGKPIFIHALEALEQSIAIDSVILVAPESHLKEFEKVLKQYDLHRSTKVVAGGKTRFESVSNGLKALDKDTEIVLVHDGARPLVTTKIIDEAINLCHNEPAVIVAVPVKPTIKRVNIKLEVKETLRRDELWEVQTPQVFKKDILLKAHEEGRGLDVTDDAALVERLGIKVKVVMGDYRNIKITTKEDLVIAEALLTLNN